MVLENTEWLVIIPILLAVIFYLKLIKQGLFFRFTLVSLLVLALLSPAIYRKFAGKDLWVLVDRSASVAEILGPTLNETESILRKTMGPNDSLHFIDFAEFAYLREIASLGDIAKKNNYSNINSAIEYAISKANKDRDNYILLLSDGYSSQSLKSGNILKNNINFNYRLTDIAQLTDFRVQEFKLPQRIKENEPFIVEAEIKGTKDIELEYKVFRNKQLLENGQLKLFQGTGFIRLADIVEESSTYEYQVEIYNSEDKILANNSMTRWMEVSGKEKILVLTSYQNDPLVSLLSKAGYNLEVLSNFKGLNSGILNNSQAVIVNNVHASALPVEFIQALEFYVKAQGGGLMMTGGKQSFGKGAYFGTTIENLLPVSLEQRSEKRKLPTSLVMVLDRSGSMGASVDGGMGGMCKLDLANEGAAKSAELLGEQDKIAVLAVDSEVHKVLPLSPVGNDLSSIVRKIRSTNVGGGGIFVYVGLEAAGKELEKDKSPVKHIILFSDAMDSEEPKEYKELLAKFRKEKIGVSVIAMGNPSDVDAKLLEEIAMLGEGRIYFVNNAVDLPMVFLQETTSLARATYVEELSAVKSSAAIWSQISSQKLDFLKQISAYNYCYPKESSFIVSSSADENDAPLIAYSYQGAGKTAAIAFPIAGSGAEAFIKWGDNRTLLQTLSRWILKSELPEDMFLKTRIEGETVNLELIDDISKPKDEKYQSPKMLIVNQNNEKREIAWEKYQAGNFQTIINLKPEEVVRGVISFKDRLLPFGPITIGKNLEWTFDQKRRDEIKEIARLSGGKEIVNLEDVWKQQSGNKKIFYLKKWILILFIVLFLLDALFTRFNYNLGFKLPNFNWSFRNLKFPAKNLTTKDRREDKHKRKAIPSDKVLVEKPEAKPVVDELSSMLSKAKKRGIDD